MKAEELIEIDPEKMGSTPVFMGTRVPIRNFFDYLEGGDTVEEFLDDFPTVEREQVMALFVLIRERLGLVED
ncbi:MAG: DUF433 domain-containing protein [Acidobacteria bacterium]|nr:DUF433 domain-containing protein [Acidobacteriota bacterium]